MRMKLLVLPAIAGLALVGACTSAQLERALSGVCTGLSAGATAIAVISPLLGVGGLTTISQVIGNVSTDCPQFASAVTAAVSDISGTNQSAQVSVSAQNVAPVASRALKSKYGVKQLAVTFVVDPSGNIVSKQ